MNQTLFSFNKIGRCFLNLIYPSECQICKASLDPVRKECLCGDCKAKIRLNLPPFCAKCGRSLINSVTALELCNDCKSSNYHFRKVWAVGHYEGILKECIHLFKFNGKLSLAPLFNELFLNFASSYMKIALFDAIVPVPLHSSKIRERTFNQAELLAKNFGRKTKIPINTSCLIRIKNTSPQTELSKNKRFLNIKGAFGTKRSPLLKDKNILLVDDVFTTGSTLDECAKILLGDGAKSVECLVLARG